MKFLKAIWRDPVGSKVIGGIILAIPFIYTYISAKVNNVDFQITFKQFWTCEVPVWATFLVVSGLIILYGLRKVFLKKNFIYDPETLKLDKAFFEKIRIDLLPQNGSIEFLRTNNFAGFAFESAQLNDLRRTIYEKENPEFEFLNPELESIKKDLIDNVSEFMLQIAGNTFPGHNGFQSVPSEWESEQPERFRKVVDQIHTTASKICNNYDKLIKTGRRFLKV